VNIAKKVRLAIIPYKLPRRPLPRRLLPRRPLPRRLLPRRLPHNLHKIKQ